MFDFIISGNGNLVYILQNDDKSYYGFTYVLADSTFKSWTNHKRYPAHIICYIGETSE